MDLEQKANVKCTKCKIYRYEKDFLNDKNRRLKTCRRCREIGTKNRNKNKCDHGRQRCLCRDCNGVSFCEHDKRRDRCRDCNGVSFCEHDKRREDCKECNGSQICEHDRRRNTCKECNGSQICEHGIGRGLCKECKGTGICEHNYQRSNCKRCKNPIKLTIRNMIRSSKESDKKCDRYDANNFIDKCFLGGLIEEYPTCYYEDCKVELQYIKRQNDMATIERLDNSIGHIKSNCVICCWECNNMKKSNR